MEFRLVFRLRRHLPIYYLLTCGWLWFSASAAHGFPPAPHFTLYGTVRDQVGQTVTADHAEVVLLKGIQEMGRTPITSGARLDQNYELHMKLDQNRGGTTLYTEKALATQSPFSLAVDIAGVRYYPIEVAGNLTTGKGGERVRLDLNLGEDTDGDGMPDVWEQWQLYQAGINPDENGNWPISLLDRNGDYDGDGISNWLEYVAGTFAGDATERFALEIKEKTATHVRFAFFAITGKTYTIEATTDMKTWARIPFSVSPAVATGSPSWQSQDVAIVSAFTSAVAGSNQFYRLTVR